MKLCFRAKSATYMHLNIITSALLNSPKKGQLQCKSWHIALKLFQVPKNVFQIFKFYEHLCMTKKFLLLPVKLISTCYSQNTPIAPWNFFQRIVEWGHSIVELIWNSEWATNTKLRRTISAEELKTIIKWRKRRRMRKKKRKRKRGGFRFAPCWVRKE